MASRRMGGHAVKDVVTHNDSPEAEHCELQCWGEEYQEQLWDGKLARDSQPGGRLEERESSVGCHWEYYADVTWGNTSLTPDPYLKFDARR